jgi:hypothetical protein
VLPKAVTDDAEDERALLEVPRNEGKAFLEKAEVVGATDEFATQNAVAVMCLPPLRVAMAMHAMIAILAVKVLESFRRGM